MILKSCQLTLILCYLLLLGGDDLLNFTLGGTSPISPRHCQYHNTQETYSESIHTPRAVIILELAVLPGQALMSPEHVPVPLGPHVSLLHKPLLLRSPPRLDSPHTLQHHIWLVPLLHQALTLPFDQATMLQLEAW